MSYLTTNANVTAGGSGTKNSGIALDIQAMNIIFNKYGKEGASYGRNEVVLTRDEIPVEHFPDAPDVLDDLGLTEQRKDMTEAQNHMIDLKNKIASALEKGTLFPEIESSSKSPFDFDSDRNRITDEDVKKRRTLMENALKAPAVSDPEFRSLTLEYLDLLIPAATKKRREMVREINSLEAEYAQLQQEYKNKIRTAKNDLKQFMIDLDQATVKRFQLTDTGKASDGGLPPIELQNIDFWKMLWISGSKYVIERLTWLRDRINEMNKVPDEDEIRDQIRSNWKSSIRDGSGSAAPIGGVFSSMFGKRG